MAEENKNPFEPPSFTVPFTGAEAGFSAGTGGDAPAASPNPFLKSDLSKDPNVDYKPLTTTDHLVDKAVEDNKKMAEVASQKFAMPSESKSESKLSEVNKLKWIRNILTVHGVKRENLDKAASQLLKLLSL